MGIELGITGLLLIALTFLASVDMAFKQLSDVGLHLLIAEVEDHPTSRSNAFLREILGNRPRFSLTLSAAIQILLIAFSVLVTSISLRLFTPPQFVFVAVLSGLLIAGIFRQFIPRLISLRNPESKLVIISLSNSPNDHFQ